MRKLKLEVVEPEGITLEPAEVQEAYNFVRQYPEYLGQVFAHAHVMVRVTEVGEPRQVTVHIVLSDDEICHPQTLAEMIASLYDTQRITVLEGDAMYIIDIRSTVLQEEEGK